eukprot:bmy_03768T0
MGLSTFRGCQDATFSSCPTLGSSDTSRLHCAAKFDLSEIKVINLECTDGAVGATSALDPKSGPLGLSPKTVGKDIAKAASTWKGLRITVKLTIQNRQSRPRWYLLPLP